jgi:hypothetical protein
MRSGVIVTRIVMSVLVPVVLLIGITMTLGDDPWRLGLSPGEFGQISLLLSITMGFTLIAGLSGRYVLIVAAFYFPMMVGVLVGLALVLPSIFHSDVP